MPLASDSFSFANSELGLYGNSPVGGSAVVKQLEAQLAEQRRRRKGGQAPSDRSMQLTSPAASDLGVSGFPRQVGF